MRAIKLDATNETIDYIELNGTLADLQKHVGGYIEIGIQFPNGDLLYVDEEGLMKAPTTYQLWKKEKRVFAGSGLIVNVDENGDDAPPLTSIEDIKKSMSFNNVTLTSLYALEWGI